MGMLSVRKRTSSVEAVEATKYLIRTYNIFTGRNCGNPAVSLASDGKSTTLGIIYDSDLKELIHHEKDVWNILAGNLTEIVQRAITKRRLSLILSGVQLTIFKSEHISGGENISPEDYNETWNTSKKLLVRVTIF